MLEDGSADYTPGVSRRASSSTTFAHAGLKNTSAQSAENETVAASRVYDAFGNTVSSSGAWSGPFGYAGEFGYQEDGSGLKLLGHRYYDSTTGRFLSQDPISDGRNWYVYGDSNPISRTDPSGEAWVLVAALIVVGIILTTETALAPTGKETPEQIQGYEKDLSEWKLGASEVVLGVAAGGAGAWSLGVKAASKIRFMKLIRKAEEKLPDGWVRSATKKGEGVRWQDPSNKGNGVRLDRGKPQASLPSQRADHVIVNSNGKVLGQDGKGILGRIKDFPEQSHIPAEEWIKWPKWNSPTSINFVF